jgi:hypothetical protein
MALSTVTASSSLAIQELQEIVQSKERVLGKLCSMGVIDTDKDMLTFTVFNGPDDIPPAGKRCSLEIVAGHPAEKVGFTLVCFGPIFVEGTLKPVAAYRPN